MANDYIRPTSDEIKAEIKQIHHRRDYHRGFRRTVNVLLAVAGVVIVISTFFFSVLRVTGESMKPTLEPGQIVLAAKHTQFSRGDLVAFYYNNRILLKRVIALEGDQVVIDNDGSVTVNGVLLNEPYISEKSLGECDLEFPYQVPEGKIFVMGDHRKTSIDSRSDSVGCISEEYIVGKLFVSIWPFNRITAY